MNNDEIRLAIAKAKGWREVHNTQGILMGGEPGEVAWWKPVPYWPTDIKAAWELVEEAQAAKVGLVLHNSLRFIPSPETWSYACTFYDPVGGPNHEVYSAEEETAPLAICRAWLAWDEGRKDRHE